MVRQQEYWQIAHILLFCCLLSKITVALCVSDLNVHLSTWCHFVRPDVTQCHVRQVADVDSQSLQQPRNDDRLNSTQFICFGPQRSISIETVDKQ